MTPKQRAERAAAAMWAGDRASQDAGMTLIAVGPGTATITMPIRADMANGHGIAHGGYIFTLADSAFAFACNSYNKNVVAQHNSITYLAPGQIGETLTATAREVALAGRSGIYDVLVTGEDGREIAQFRGHSRQIGGQHFDETETETQDTVAG
ncbi:hydroxyphenylacetyl-CoA thioesterase PaaI [Aliiroseovarius sp.]|uniref:hydroxyphenylacetyl-CoA thioesterase PaaI n=1 Tax=Aliiroseovarius sp. TaxID=1872442 RepID=UPI003BACC42F